MSIRAATPVRVPRSGAGIFGALVLVGAAAAVGGLVPLRPSFAIALVLVAGVALVVAVDPGSLPVFLIFTMFVESLALGPGLRVGRLAGALAVLVLAFWLLDRGVGRLRPNALLAAAAGFGLWTLASAYWADVPSLTYTQGLSFVLAAAYMLSFAVIVREPRQLTAILATLAVGSLVFGVVSFVEYAASSGTTRAAGLQGDPNYFATYQVIALPAALVLAATERRWLRRLGYYAVVGVIVLSVVSSLSRTGLLALAVAIVATLVLPSRAFFRRRSQKLSYALAIGAAAALAALVGSASFVARAHTILDPSAGDDRGSGRTDLWAAAVHGWRDHPFRGLGAGNFQAHALDLLQTTPGVNTQASYVAAGRVVHNAYLGVLTELGVVGLALFASLLLLTAWYFVRTSRRARAAGDLFLERISLALLVSLLGYALSAIFLSNELGKPLWILIGLALALDVRSRSLARAPAGADAAPAPKYDATVRRDLLEEREQELARRQQALLLDQERIDRRRAAMAEREREIEARERELAKAGPVPQELAAFVAGLREELAEARAQVTELERQLEVDQGRRAEEAERLATERAAAEQAAREQAEREAAERAARERELQEQQRREQEAAQAEAVRRREEEAAAVQAPPARGEPSVPGDTYEPRTGEWSLPALESLVDRVSGEHPPEQVDEWSAYILFLRDHASIDGMLPPSFDSLVWEVFGELVERARA